MHLITMAHMGEALGVIENFKLKKISSHEFENDFITLVLTGEGPFEAATIVASSLARKKFFSVINLGIAGSLDSELSIGSIHEVRHCYLIQDDRPGFKSYAVSSTGLDCLTTFKRIKTAQDREILKGVGKLVDREAWGIAHAAKFHQVPFKSYKLISDFAGSDACEEVKDKAEEWAQKLGSHLEDVLNITRPEKSELSIPGIHLTFSHRHKVQSLLQKLSKKSELSEADYLQSVLGQINFPEKSLPKERATILIEELESSFDPFKKAIDLKLKSWKKPFEDSGIQLVTDPNLESRKVRVTFEAETSDEISKKIDALKSLSLDPFKDLMNGNIHVE